MPPLAYFGIESSGLNLAIDLLILFVVVLYFAVIFWTYVDARRRIEDPTLIGCAVVASLFPFVGAIVYMIVRPPEYIEDVHERELETQAAEARVRELQGTLCPHCDYRVERDFIRCPSCLRKLKERCSNCSRPLDRAWTICPYCEADVPGIAPSRSRRRRGGAALEGELNPVDAVDNPVDAVGGQAAAMLGEAASSPEGQPTETALVAAPSTEGEPTALAAASSPDVEAALTPAERRSAERRAAAGARASRPGGRTRPST
jgi:hypothetical protein